MAVRGDHCCLCWRFLQQMEKAMTMRHACDQSLHHRGSAVTMSHANFASSCITEQEPQLQANPFLPVPYARVITVRRCAVCHSRAVMTTSIVMQVTGRHCPLPGKPAKLQLVNCGQLADATPASALDSCMPHVAAQASQGSRVRLEQGIKQGQEGKPSGARLFRPNRARAAAHDTKHEAAQGAHCGAGDQGLPV